MKKSKVNRIDTNISKIIDTTGLYCPVPMAMLKIELEEVKNSEIVKIIADDPGFERDLPVWCNSAGNKLLLLEKNENGIISGYVKKGK